MVADEISERRITVVCPQCQLLVGAQLISGSGSNLQALIDAQASRNLARGRIVRVVSNKKNAYGLERAQKAGIPTAYHNLVPYGKSHPSNDPSTKYGIEARRAYDVDLARLVLEDKPHLIVCAGWMHILTTAFLDLIDATQVQCINLHPSLPAPNLIQGAGAIERAYEAFQGGKIDKTGIMIHYVVEGVDLGEPIVWEEVPIKHGEALAELEERMHTVEHKLIVQATARLTA